MVLFRKVKNQVFIRIIICPIIICFFEGFFLNHGVFFFFLFTCIIT